MESTASSTRRGRKRKSSRFSARYLLVRVLSLVVTLWLAATLDFALPRLAGGDPAQYLASTTSIGSPGTVAALRKEFGLQSGSSLTQYWDYLRQLLHGNLGVSYEFYPQTVGRVLLTALPYTVALVLSAVVISYAAGWALGVISAWRHRSLFDEMSVGVSFFFTGVPYFWVALLLIFVFSFLLGWFPSGHAFSVGDQGGGVFPVVLDAVYHGLLPVASLVLTSVAGHLLIMRNNMLSVLKEDYIALARAKGLHGRTLLFKYAARTAMLPSFTGLMLALGSVVSGAIVTEEVYSYPGLGFTVYNAILNHDYPLIQGGFLLIAVVVIVLNFVADLVYPLLDPRVVIA
jgi:peptide/nickel transport system permease protein